MRPSIICSAAGIALCCASMSLHAYELVINNGRVVDPDSGFDQQASVGITAGRIEMISAAPLSGDQVIDASGLVVSPGFINLHTHGATPAGQRLEVLDGITTALELEAGAYPVAAFGAHLRDQALINYGASVGHALIRMQLFGYASATEFMVAGGGMNSEAFREPLSADQMDVMSERLDRGVQGGGLGIGLLLDYMRHAISDEEMERVFAHAARGGVPIFTHVRRGIAGDPAGLAQVIRVARDTGASVHICHINASAMGGIGQWIAMIDAARADGVDISAEMYPWTAGSTAISADVFWRNWREIFAIDYSDVQWAATGEWLTEESFNRYQQTQPAGQTIHHYIREDWNRTAIGADYMLVASDAMPVLDFSRKVVPNGSGTSARILGQYVREEGLLTLSEAIRRLSLMPAQRLESFAPVFRRKGRLSVGADADLAIFDPATVAARATYMDPFLSPVGMRHVVVNGVVVVADGAVVEGVTPGRQLLATDR